MILHGWVNKTTSARPLADTRQQKQLGSGAGPMMLYGSTGTGGPEEEHDLENGLKPWERFDLVECLMPFLANPKCITHEQPASAERQFFSVPPVWWKVFHDNCKIKCSVREPVVALGHYPNREIPSAGGHPSFGLSREHLLDCLSTCLLFRLPPLFNTSTVGNKGVYRFAGGGRWQHRVVTGR